MQRVGLATCSGHVLGRPPSLEQDTRDPAAGHLDREARVHLCASRRRKRVRRLGGREREICVGDRDTRARGRGGPQAQVELAAADQHHPHRARGVPQQSGDHRERLPRIGEALEFVDHQQDGHAIRSLGQQAGRFGVGKPRGQRLGRNTLGLGDLDAERGLEIGQQPPGRGVGVVERQPGDRAPGVRQRLGDRRGLARSGRRTDPHDRVLFDQLRH